jgi:hypothetical protein
MAWFLLESNRKFCAIFRRHPDNWLFITPGRCLRDLFAYSRRAELISMEQIQFLVAERVLEIGGRLGEELRTISQIA